MFFFSNGFNKQWMALLSWVTNKRDTVFLVSYDQKNCSEKDT